MVTHFVGQRVSLDLSKSPPSASIRKFHGLSGTIIRVGTMGFDWGVQLDDPKAHDEGLFPANSDELSHEEGPW